MIVKDTIIIWWMARDDWSEEIVCSSLKQIAKIINYHLSSSNKCIEIKLTVKNAEMEDSMHCEC